MVQKIWQDNKLMPVPQAVINRPGGGGEIGWAYFTYWDGVLAATVATPEWKATMAKDHQEAVYLSSHEMKKHMEKEREQYRAILTQLGLVK